MQEHLARLFQGAKSIDMDLGMSQSQLQDLIYRAVDANGMGQASGVHIRLMVTRGLKPTPYQAPATTIGAPTIVILPEWKEASSTPKEQVRVPSVAHVPNWRNQGVAQAQRKLLLLDKRVPQ